MKWLLLLGMGIATFFAFVVPPAQLFPEPQLARLIFFHLPCAFGATLFVIFGSYASWRYLATKDMLWEYRAFAANEMAMVLACATMITGIIFSRVQWGAWWHWDPRQTSFLIVLLLLGAYFAVRMAFDDDTSRARASAGYSALTLLPNLFLIFVFPRLPQVAQYSLHPQQTVIKGQFSPDYWAVVLGVFVMLLAFSIWLYRTHVKVSLLEAHRRSNNGILEDHAGSGTAPRRVDRAVPL